MWVEPGGTGLSVPCDGKRTVQTPPPAETLAGYGKSGAPLTPRAEARGARDQRDQMSLFVPSSPCTSWA